MAATEINKGTCHFDVASGPLKLIWYFDVAEWYLKKSSSRKSSYSLFNVVVGSL